MSTMAESLSLAARQDLLLDTRQDLSFSAVQSWDTKCFLFLLHFFSSFLFVIYTMRGSSREECHATTTSEIRDFGERTSKRTSCAFGCNT